MHGDRPRARASRRLRDLGLGVALFSTASGCVWLAGDDDPEPDDATIAAWANAGSALGVWKHIHAPVAAAAGEQAFVDDACPVVEDDGTILTITGGCTDEEERSWFGMLVVERVDGTDLRLEFDDFGSGESYGEASRTSGVAAVRLLDADFHLFEVDVTVAAETTETIVYQGSVAGGFATATTWNGTGEIEREGAGPALGHAIVSTMGQIVDDALCSGQSADGRTLIEVEDHEIDVAYDGAEDCDDAAAARVAVDGVDRGRVEGITCAVAPGRRPPPGLLLLVALFGLARRRRSPARSAR